MSHINVEIKARCPEPARVREALLSRRADFRGLDRQVDTYFSVPHGRLKLRQGNIETSLVQYDRSDTAGPKKAMVRLHHPGQGADELKEALAAALGIQVIVRKSREIYFIQNVKFHIDDVEGLGSFVEIEAIDSDGTLGIKKLQGQCRYYMGALEIDPADLQAVSYADMLMGREGRSEPGRSKCF